jgi:hypothetical protein
MCDEADEKVKEVDDPGCPNCHAPEDCTRGPNCACCKAKVKEVDQVVKEPDYYQCCEHCVRWASLSKCPYDSRGHAQTCPEYGCEEGATLK